MIERLPSTKGIDKFQNLKSLQIRFSNITKLEDIHKI